MHTCSIGYSHRFLSTALAEVLGEYLLIIEFVRRWYSIKKLYPSYTEWDGMIASLFS